jgi:hypothetical protein
MLREGEFALLVDDGGLDAVNHVARALDAPTVSIVRTEGTPAAQEATVRTWAASLPLVWIGQDFSEDAQAWARDRGPMTLLVEVTGPLSEEERRRIDRFVAILGRQSE